MSGLRDAGPLIALAYRSGCLHPCNVTNWSYLAWPIAAGKVVWRQIVGLASKQLIMRRIPGGCIVHPVHGFEGGLGTVRRHAVRACAGRRRAGSAMAAWLSAGRPRFPK